MNEVIEKVKYYIERDELQSKTRKQDIVYKRAYLMHVLRCQELTFNSIGKMFKRDHATAIYQCKMAKRYLYELKDHSYIMTLTEYIEAFEGHKNEPVKFNLQEDVLNCKNGYYLKLIKKRIKENKYEVDATLLE